MTVWMNPTYPWRVSDSEPASAPTAVRFAVV